MFNLRKKSLKRFDLVLFITVLLLCAYGILMIRSATLTFDNLRSVKVQAFSTILGIIAIVFLTLLDYEFMGKIYIPIYIVSVLLLVAVALFGTGVEKWGSRSWLAIGGFKFQPAEISKVGLIIFLAKYIDNNKNELNRPLTLFKILFFSGIPILLIAKQPDFGTSIVLVFFLAVMLFVAGLDWKYIGYAFLSAIISLPILWFSLKDYQRNRILNFLDPERDIPNTGYQAMQGRVAIGSGKVFGRGLFKGVYTQFNYIPEKQTDFIFAVIGEELGLIGGLTLIILYFIMLYRLIKIAKDSNDMFGSLMVIGITAMFVAHIWENIGMTIGLMPITGIPLPFLSYGGTFQLVNMVCIGIALSVCIHKDGLNF
ncbi:rod shape-determining protein RodA [Tissierella sp. MSJ-40]|uniref:Peptidoglycan glycosyltransferase RodA n=1 Tax=Tissierella simiarum TaxID=2841534 RepID=A0ABS6E503_9FIRM|nr:rod shape-determining protein RodA [Tissierella simiarum]MBU5437839.1 rod shape-determining protein RodA [Tissierella simiarum]